MDPLSTSVPDLRLLHVPSVPQLEHPTPSSPPHGVPNGSILRFPHTLRVRWDGLHGTPLVNSSLGRILCALQPPVTHTCVNSGASCDMCLIKEFFEDYIPNTDNSHITVADRCRIKVAGSRTLHIILGSHPIRLRNCLHVPDLDMFLLSTRIHRHRGQGCTVIADPTGCFLTFPSFIIPIDNTLECLAPCSAAPPTATFDHDYTNTLTYPEVPIIHRRSAKRAFHCHTWHHNGSARLVTRAFDYGTLIPELLPDPVPKVIPIPFLLSSIDTTNIPLTVRTSELPLSSAGNQIGSRLR